MATACVQPKECSFRGVSGSRRASEPKASASAAARGPSDLAQTMQQSNFQHAETARGAAVRRPVRRSFWLGLTAGLRECRTPCARTQLKPVPLAPLRTARARILAVTECWAGHAGNPAPPTIGFQGCQTHSALASLLAVHVGGELTERCVLNSQRSRASCCDGAASAREACSRSSQYRIRQCDSARQLRCSP